MSDIKIVMLGGTGSGKSCYMLGMYATMQIGLNGLSLSAKDLDDDLRLTDMWEKLVEVKDEKRWPPPNDQNPISYEFQFNYGFKPILDFEWLDYRGGAIASLTSEADVPMLVQQLSASNCIFLCVSGEYLKDPLTPQGLAFVARETRINRMSAHMAKVGERVKPSKQKPFPVVIVITKYDVCSNRGPDEVIEDIKKLFPSLFTPNAGWLTMICPVSLGMELANDKNSGDIRPINLHLPIAFAVYARFREQMLNHKTTTDRAKQQLDEAQQRGLLWRIFNGDIIKNGVDNFQRLQGELAQIENNLLLLTRELSRARIFLDGKEIEIGI